MAVGMSLNWRSEEDDIVASDNSALLCFGDTLDWI